MCSVIYPVIYLTPKVKGKLGDLVRGEGLSVRSLVFGLFPFSEGNAVRLLHLRFTQ